MSQCWPLQGMSAAQKAVLISLADQANDEGVCWPSIGSIAKRTCLSSRSVQEAIAWLQSVRALQRAYRANSSTYYTVTPGSYSPESAEPKRTRNRKASTTPADGAPPADGAGVQMAQEGGANGAGEGVQMAHPTPADGAPRTVIEPSVEPSEEPPSSLPAVPASPAKGKSKDEAEQARQDACREIWSAYSSAYEQRYRTAPIRNAKVNRHVNDLLKRLGAEAAAVAAYYVGINDTYLIRTCHDFGGLLAKAEAYRTQWATNLQMSSTKARQQEQTQANVSSLEQALAEQRARREANA